MTYLPFLGAFMESVGILLEKNVLRTKKIDYRNYSGPERVCDSRADLGVGPGG